MHASVFAMVSSFLFRALLSVLPRLRIMSASEHQRTNFVQALESPRKFTNTTVLISGSTSAFVVAQESSAEALTRV